MIRPPTAARRKLFFSHRSARRSVMCSPRQNRMLTSAQPTASAVTSPSVGQLRAGMATVKRVGSTPMTVAM